MGPWIKVAGHLGGFIGQMTDEPINAINILYDGEASTMNLEALNCALIVSWVFRRSGSMGHVAHRHTYWTRRCMQIGQVI